MLLNRSKVSAQLDTLQRVARKQRYAGIRSLSMGDKDLFHMAWMMHDSNFTLVPYIGETGQLELSAHYVRTVEAGRVVKTPVEVLAWSLSSQVKYGRDGAPYALHQLHRARPGKETLGLHVAKNARLRLADGLRDAPGDAARTHAQRSLLSAQALISAGHGRGAYVRPALSVRKDLRARRNASEALDDGGWRLWRARRNDGDFVADAERALVRDRLWERGARNATAAGAARGVRVRVGAGDGLATAAADANQLWGFVQPAERRGRRVADAFARRSVGRGHV